MKHDHCPFLHINIGYWVCVAMETMRLVNNTKYQTRIRTIWNTKLYVQSILTHTHTHRIYECAHCTEYLVSIEHMFVCFRMQIVMYFAFITTILFLTRKRKDWCVCVLVSLFR